MKLNSLENRLLPIKDLEILREASKIKGKIFSPAQVMSTVMGKKVHLKLQINKTEFADYALCGAGLPNRLFPQGSSILLSEDIIKQATTQKKGMVVDCYKCLKLNYMNTVNASAILIPTRNFDPSDQQPDKHTWGQKLTPSQEKKLDPKDIKYVLQKNNVFVFYSKLRDQSGKYKKGQDRFRSYVEKKEKDVGSYVKELVERGFTVKTQVSNAPSSYKRRREHVMIPFGRQGMFGANTPSFNDPQSKQNPSKPKDNGITENDGITAEEYLERKYGISEPKESWGFSEDDVGRMKENGWNVEDNFEWLDEYFSSPQNTWHVGPKRRRTQQTKATKGTPSYSTTELSNKKLSTWDYERFPEEGKKVKIEKQVEEIKNNLEAMRKALRDMPIKTFLLVLAPKSTLANSVWLEIREERANEISSYTQAILEMKAEKKNKKKKPKKKKGRNINPANFLALEDQKSVPQIVELINNLDTMLVSWERDYAKNRR